MRFKKILAAVSAAVVMSAGTVCNVSASAPASYDVNYDGYVNIADAVYLYSYLRGSFYLSNYSSLDLNNNGLITNFDARLIELSIAGVI